MPLWLAVLPRGCWATSWKTGLPWFYGKRGTPGNTSILTLTTLNLSNALNTAQLTSVYFRVSINLTAGQVANAPLKFQYILDDGAVFYANGTEVLRTGMPATPTPPLNGTFASRTVGNDMLWEVPIIFNSAPLSAGANTFPAEVHQINNTSSDLAFALRLIGTQATIVPPLRITSISLETPGNAPIPNVIIRHNGADVPGDEYGDSSRHSRKRIYRFFT